MGSFNFGTIKFERKTIRIISSCSATDKVVTL